MSKKDATGSGTRTPAVSVVDAGFKARDLAAHGRTELLSYERRVRWGEDRTALPVTTDLESCCKLETAERFLDDISEMKLHKMGKDPALLWTLGQTQYVRSPDVDAD